MDNDMLGKIGRGFWNDGIFGAVRAAFGIDQQRQTRTMADKNGPGVGRLVPEGARVKRLVIDDSGIEGFEVDAVWLDRFRKVQPFTISSLTLPFLVPSPLWTSSSPATARR